MSEWKERRADAGIEANDSNAEVDRQFKEGDLSDADAKSLAAFVKANPREASEFADSRDDEGNAIPGRPILVRLIAGGKVVGWEYREGR